MTEQVATPEPAGPSPAALHRARRPERVAMLRAGLQGVAVALLAACVIQVTWRGLPAPAPPANADQASKMQNPRFSGQSRDGRSYSLTGREGMADPKDPDLILIDQPTLTLHTRSNRTTRMTAATGVYDEAANTLLLKGQVRVDDGAGSRFSSERAVIDTRTGAVSGQSGLRAEGPTGSVQARDYTVLDEGDRMILRGGVRGRLSPQN